MNLKELEELKECNELDLLYKIIEKSENIKKRTEHIIKGNKSAGIDVRKTMQDIRLLSEIIRDLIQQRRANRKSNKKTKLNTFIDNEKKRLIKEESRIKKLEAKRIAKR